MIDVRLESTCGTFLKKASFERKQCRQDLPTLPPMEKLKGSTAAKLCCKGSNEIGRSFQ